MSLWFKHIMSVHLRLLCGTSLFLYVTSSHNVEQSVPELMILRPQYSLS